MQNPSESAGERGLAERWSDLGVATALCRRAGRCERLDIARQNLIRLAATRISDQICERSWKLRHEGMAAMRELSKPGARNCVHEFQGI